MVLEDCHWLDPLSHDLIEVIARALVDLPVLLVLVYRPPQVRGSTHSASATSPHFTEWRSRPSRSRSARC